MVSSLSGPHMAAAGLHPSEQQDLLPTRCSSRSPTSKQQDHFPSGLQINGPTVITTLSISLVWIIYAAIPCYLVLHYTWIGRGTTLQFMCRVCFLVGDCNCLYIQCLSLPCFV